MLYLLQPKNLFFAFISMFGNYHFISVIILCGSIDKMLYRTCALSIFFINLRDYGISASPRCATFLLVCKEALALLVR